MNRSITFVVCLALLLAGLAGITLSVPLQAPSVIAFGLGAFCAGLLLLARPEGEFRAKGLLVLSLAATAYFAARAVMSPVPDLAVQDLMLLLPAGTLYLTAGFICCGRTAERFRQGLAWVVVALLLCHSVAASMQLAGGSGFSLVRYLSPAVADSGGRITGMYGYYGSFANFMVIAGLLSLSLGVWGRFRVFPRGVFICLGCSALGLAVWSQSRSAAVSMVVALLTLAVLLVVSLAGQKPRIKRRGYTVVVLVAAVGLVAGLAGGAWVFKNRALDSTEKASEMMFDSGVRMPFWSMAAEQWADHPILGAGSRSYSYLANRYWSPNLPTGEASPVFVHNEYLQLLADYGLVGLSLVLCLLFWHLILGARRVRLLSKQVGGIVEGSNAMALTITGVCGMVAMAVHIVFDFRTHLLANLLLFVCCAVWVLPIRKSGGRGVGESRLGSWGLSLAMLVLGGGATGLGALQLWAGLPLLEKQIVKEDGTWNPAAVPRVEWIPAFEKSVARVADFNRYQRLATLYQLEANDLSGEARDSMLDQAVAAYQASVDRNPYNPVPWINLAAIHAGEGRYEKADHAYARASEMAAARERWFRMHSRWALLQQQWAGREWREGNNEQAEAHFLRAKRLFLKSYDHANFYQNKQWVVEYTRLLIAYARFLDSQKRFEDAEAVFAEARKQVNWVNWQRDSKLNFYYGVHLYEMGRQVWYQRKPEQAYQLMRRAKAQLQQHRNMMKENVEPGFAKRMKEVNQVIKFLERAGINRG